MTEPEVNELSAEHCTGNLATDSASRHADVRRARTRYPHRAEPVRPRTGIEREFAERDALDTKLTTQASMWRDEVASRVDSYRARRSKKSLAGEFSMKFDFDPRPAVQASAAAPKLATPEIEPVYAEPVPEPQPQARILPAEPPVAKPESMRITEELAEPVQPALPEPVYAPAPRVPVREPREIKIIEFPRSLMFPGESAPMPRDANELAEPVANRPLILDVPETVSVEASPLLDLSLDSEAEEDAAPKPDFDLPLQVAPLPQRFTAALLDWLMVLAGTAVFVLIVFQGAPGLPRTMPMLGLAATIPVIFWMVYNCLFLGYAATTPGMQAAGIRVSTFRGDWPTHRLRCWRAVMMVLSCAPLGFGFLWALFDEDNLCWHDKVTRTYLTVDK